MGAIVNRRRAYGGKSLPYDAEIEYLQSNGQNYIVFDSYNPIVDGYKLEIDYNLTSNAIIGAQNKGIFFYNRVLRLQGTGLNIPYRVRQKVLCYYHNNGMDVYINGVFNDTITKEAIDYGNVKYCLFAQNYASINSSADTVSPGDVGVGTIYSLRIWSGNKLMLDFIPVRVGTTGYMYDKVSGQLFGNDGTGDFILGPDV